MFKRVDGSDNEPVEGFSYLNRNGTEEFVEMDFGTSNYVKVIADDESVCIYKEDIPKLIEALQAAYDFKGN